MEKAAVGAGGYILLLVYAGVRCHPAARLVVPDAHSQVLFNQVIIK